MSTERDSAGPDQVGTVEDLHASATRLTGLAEFGSDAYRDGLAVLLDSYARDAGLTPLGRKLKRVFLRGALVYHNGNVVGPARGRYLHRPIK